MRISMIGFILMINIICVGQNYLFQSQTFFKPYLTNPALAGFPNNGDLSLIYNKKLIGFDNSPNSQVISVDYPFSKNQIGIGMNGFKEQNGAISFVGFESTFSYHLIKEEKEPKSLTAISFGLSASYNQYSIDRLRLMMGNSDNNIFNDESKFFNAYPSANIGFNFFSHGFNLGFSAYNIIPNVSSVFTNESDIQNALFTFITSGLDLQMTENLKIKPNFIFRTQKNADYQLDIMLDVSFYLNAGSQLSLSPVFRNYVFEFSGKSKALGLNTMFIKHPLRVGYQFDLPLSATINFSNSGHILMIGYILTAKPKMNKKDVKGKIDNPSNK